MANIRYNVPCPSCEADVPIRSTASIGKKIECPKCKYRFTVPEPPDDDADAKGKKGKGKKEAGKPAKKKGSPMLIVGIVLGVLAVGALAVGGYVLMSDETPTAGNTKSGGGGTTGGGGASGLSGGGVSGGATTGTPDGAGTTDPANPMGTGTTPAVGATGGETPMATPHAAGTGKDITNLLPGESVAVYRLNFDQLARNAQPLSTALFDAGVRDQFANSMAIKTEDLETYIHCVVNPIDRDTFGVIRTKNPVNRVQMYNRLKIEKATNSPVRGRDLYVIKSNAFIDALSSALTAKSLISLTGLPIPAPDVKPSPGQAAKKYALCIYDDTTVLIGTELVVERFLGELQDNGFPPYKSDLTPEAPPADATPADGMPPGTTPPAGPPAGRGGPPPGPPAGRGGPPGGTSFLFPKNDFAPRGENTQTPPGGLRPLANPGSPSAGGQPPGAVQPPAGFGPPGTGAPSPMGAPAAGPRPRLFTSIPTYRTIDPQLKKMLNQLEPDDANPPVFVYAEIVDHRVLSTLSLAEAVKGAETLVNGLLGKVKVVGFVLNKFTKERVHAVAAAEYVSDDDARSSAASEITPLLNLARLPLDAMLGTRTTVRRGGQATGGFAGAEGVVPGGPFPPGAAGGGVFPPTGAAGGPMGLVPRGAPGGGVQPPGPPGGTPGPMGAFQPPGGTPDGGDFPPQGAPAAPTGPPPGQGTVDVDQSDRSVTITIQIGWTDEKFYKEVNPRVLRIAGQLKGRMAVLSGETDYYSLASVATTLKGRQTAFPRGTLERDVVEQRYRLAYPPEQRVSFFAELLPFLGKGNLRAQIQEKKHPWYAAENLSAAETWVPEFLVPYYPQDSWRATHPLAQGRVLGATNYAAPAGLGLDAARYNPNDPAQAKLVGITGYDWGSKPEDVKDGLSNTIYMVQLPPGQGRPWMAGGGSTVIGIDDKAADPMRDYVHKTPTGARGTYVLMADGSVRFLKEGTDPKVFKGMITRAGGETLGDLDTVAPKQKSNRPLDGELRAGSSTGGSSTASTTTGDTKPAPKTETDADELKKFQGRWKVTLMSAAGVVLPADKLAELRLEATFDGARATLSGAGKPTETDDVVKLDPSASPKQIDFKDGKSGKLQAFAYEFVGDTKLKIRGGEPGSPRPTKVGPTEPGSKEVYMELERVGK